MTERRHIPWSPSISGVPLFPCACDLLFSYFTDQYCCCGTPLTAAQIDDREHQGECILDTFCCPCLVYRVYTIAFGNKIAGKTDTKTKEAARNHALTQAFLACIFLLPIDRKSNPCLANVQRGGQAVFFCQLRLSTFLVGGYTGESGIQSCITGYLCAPCSTAQLQSYQEKNCDNFDKNNCAASNSLIQPKSIAMQRN